jgi:uncharacterized protein YaiL (DUF2058 family)
MEKSLPEKQMKSERYEPKSAVEKEEAFRLAAEFDKLLRTDGRRMLAELEEQDKAKEPPKEE